MVLRRQDYSKAEFTEKFTETLLYSAIDAESYIDWTEIEAQVAKFSNQFNKLSKIEAESDAEFARKLEPLLQGEFGEAPLYKLCFRLLGVGKSKDEFVVRDGVWETETGRLVETDDQEDTELADILVSAGIREVVEQGHSIKTLLIGIELGLKSHSRKNRQGDLHEKLLKEELEQIETALSEAGFHLELRTQESIDYENSSGSKTVDFAFVREGVPIIVFEANCYSAQGSKPSEIKRSYETVARKMNNDGIEYVWVTDGFAWKSSLNKILGEAFQTHPNLYNIAMVEDELENDIIQFLEEGGREDTQQAYDPQQNLHKY